MAKESLPSRTAWRMSAVVTEMVAPSWEVHPRSLTFCWETPRTMGVVEVDCWSFTRCWLSPMEIQMELAGHTAS